MPYIDFCFMLIIIFVGMIAIAIFEPLGKTDLQTVPSKIINPREGKNPIKPVGIQENPNGVGEKTDIIMRPLIGRTGGGVKPAIMAPPGLQPLAQSAQAGPKPDVQGSKNASGPGDKPNNYVNPEELKKLQEEIEKQKAEILKLKATQKEGTGGVQPPTTGKGDNYYIDLRSK